MPLVQTREKHGLPAPCPTLNELIESSRQVGSEVEVVLGEVDNNANLMVMLMLNWEITMLLRLRLQSLRLLEMGLLLPLHRWCTIPSNPPANPALLLEPLEPLTVVRIAPEVVGVALHSIPTRPGAPKAA